MVTKTHDNKTVRVFTQPAQFGYITYAIFKAPTEIEGKFITTRYPIGPFPTKEESEIEVKKFEKTTEETVEAFAKSEFEWFRENPIDSSRFEIKIVKFEGKHSDSYYLARSRKDMQNILFEQFKINDMSGYYSHYEGVKEPVKPTYFDSLDNIPSEFKEEAKKKIANYKTEVQYFKKAKAIVALLERARKGDKLAASDVVESTSSEQYQRYEIITPDQPEI